MDPTDDHEISMVDSGGQRYAFPVSIFSKTAHPYEIHVVHSGRSYPNDPVSDEAVDGMTYGISDATHNFIEELGSHSRVLVIQVLLEIWLGFWLNLELMFKMNLLHTRNNNFEWNPAGYGIMWKAYNFSIFLLSQNSTLTLKE
ncbi:nicastrin, partial [Striga asiatica]